MTEIDFSKAYVSYLQPDVKLSFQDGIEGKDAAQKLPKRFMSDLEAFCLQLKQLVFKIYAYCLKQFFKIYQAFKNVSIKTQRFIFEGKEGASALKIQTLCRKFLAKDKVSRLQKDMLPAAIWETAAFRLKNFGSKKNSSRASCGNTPVYLPEDLPVVFKESRGACEKRMDQMRSARRLCEENMLSHLVVPRVRHFRNFLVESRLPIPNNSFEEQMGIYFNNLSLFDQAAAEFTRFVFLADVSDIASCQLNAIGPNARYDNFPLYIEENQGKVGLIDLELCSFAQEDNTPEQSSVCRCKGAILLFPYHFQKIVETAKEYDQNLNEKDLQELESYRDEAQRFYKLFYIDHLAFLQKNGISFETPEERVEVTQERKEAIKQVFFNHVEQGLLEPAEPLLRTRLKEKEAFLSIFKRKKAVYETAFSAIVDSVMKYLEESAKENLDGKIVSNYASLMRCRKLTFKRGDGDWYAIKELLYRENLGLCRREDDDHLTLAIKIIFLELSKGGEISYYTPGNRSSQYLFF